MSENKVGRKVYIDILKILAAFFVIGDHTNIYWCAGDQIKDASMWEWYAASLWGTINHCAVTVFVMCSGALLLGKEESYKEVIIRIIKFALVLFIFSLFYYLTRNVGNYNVKEFVNLFISGKDNVVSFWYIYMYLALITMLPILRKMVKQFEQKDYFWLFFFTVLCSFDFIININNDFRLPIFEEFIGIFVLGFYIDKFDINEVLFKVKEKTFFFSTTILLIMDVGFVTVYSVQEMLENICVSNRFYCWDNVFYMYMAFYFMYWLKKYTEKMDVKMEKCFITMAKYTFCIYLIQEFVIAKLKRVQQEFILFSNMPAILEWLIYDILIFLICFFCSFIIKKIPVIKKII